MIPLFSFRKLSERDARWLLAMMFYRVTDGSKVALVALVDRLRERGYELLDVQMTTPHTERLGAVEIPRREYLRRLRQAVRKKVSFV